MAANSISSIIRNIVSSNHVAVFSKSFCPFCKLAKDVLYHAGVEKPYIMELDQRNDSDIIQAELKRLTNVNTVPYVFINKNYIGGGTTVESLHETGKLKQLLTAMD